MTLDTEAAVTTPETPAPAPEAKTPAPQSPDILKEPQSEAEKIETAEREELRKAYRKAQADSPSEPEEPEPKVTKDPKTGKFVSLKEEVNVSDDDKAPKADKPEPKAKDEKKEPKDKEPEAPKKAAVEAPKHWDDKRKAALAKLDPEEQEAFVKEYGELHKTATNHGRALKAVEPVLKVLQEHKKSFDQYGVSYDQGIASLLRAHDALSNPDTARGQILELARRYNVDLGTPQTQDADDEWIDPNVQTLRQELAAERERSNRIEQYLHGFAQQQQVQVAQAKEHSMVGLIDQFAQGKDDFEALQQDIIDRVQMIQAVQPKMSADQVLAKAYHEARILSPVTQERVLSERAAENAAKAEKARKAAALNVSSEPDPSTATSDHDLYRQIYRKHNAA